MCPGIRQLAVADPGFPSGAANFRGGCPILLFLNYVPKLHENERIWAEGNHASLAPLLDPSMVSSVFLAICIASNILLFFYRLLMKTTN